MCWNTMSMYLPENQCLLIYIHNYKFPLKIKRTIDTFYRDLISLLNSYYIDFKSLNRIVSYRHEWTNIEPCIVSSTMYRDAYRIAVKMYRYTPKPGTPQVSYWGPRWIDAATHQGSYWGIWLIDRGRPQIFYWGPRLSPTALPHRTWPGLLHGSGDDMQTADV